MNSAVAERLKKPELLQQFATPWINNRVAIDQDLQWIEVRLLDGNINCVALAKTCSRIYPHLPP